MAMTRPLQGRDRWFEPARTHFPAARDERSEEPAAGNGLRVRILEVTARERSGASTPECLPPVRTRPDPLSSRGAPLGAPRRRSVRRFEPCQTQRRPGGGDRLAPVRPRPDPCDSARNGRDERIARPGRFEPWKSCERAKRVSTPSSGSTPPGPTEFSRRSERSAAETKRPAVRTLRDARSDHRERARLGTVRTRPDPYYIVVTGTVGDLELRCLLKIIQCVSAVVFK